MLAQMQMEQCSIMLFGMFCASATVSVAVTRNMPINQLFVLFFLVVEMMDGSAVPRYT